MNNKVNEGAKFLGGAIAGYLVNKGLIGHAQAADFVLAFVALSSFIWSMWEGGDKRVIEKAVALPEVKAIIAPAVADQIKAPEVVATISEARQVMDRDQGRLY